LVHREKISCSQKFHPLEIRQILSDASPRKCFTRPMRQLPDKVPFE